jgi:hypothetical protein
MRQGHLEDFQIKKIVNLNEYDRHRKSHRDRQRTEWREVAIQTRRALLDSDSGFGNE